MHGQRHGLCPSWVSSIGLVVLFNLDGIPRTRVVLGKKPSTTNGLRPFGDAALLQMLRICRINHEMVDNSPQIA